MGCNGFKQDREVQLISDFCSPNVGDSLMMGSPVHFTPFSPVLEDAIPSLFFQ
jgi:hypothetical protein